MSTLILGGSGFVGSRVVKEFAKSGSDILSYDVVQSDLSGTNARFIKADLLEPLALERVFFENHVETVVHVVGLPDIAQCEKDPQLSFNLNVLSLQNTLEPMRKADVDFVIFTSSAAVYGYTSPTPVTESDPLSPNTVYGYHKLIGEKMVESYAKSYGLKYAVLRLFNVYGADPSAGKDVLSIFIRRALNHQPMVLKGPKKFRDFVHVDDVVSTISKVAALRPSSATFNIGTGTKVSLDLITDSIKRNFKDAQVTLEPVPDDGSGIYADISRLKSAVDVNFRDSAQGIEKHISGFAPHAR